MADAEWYALSTNQKHGLRRTREDKRKAVSRALEIDPDRSDREIARHLGVSHPFVARLRRNLTPEVPGLLQNALELEKKNDFERAQDLYDRIDRDFKLTRQEARLIVEGDRRCREALAPSVRAKAIGMAKAGADCGSCRVPGKKTVPIWFEASIRRMCQECAAKLFQRFDEHAGFAEAAE
jgi:hypothetical protein